MITDRIRLVGLVLSGCVRTWPGHLSRLDVGEGRTAVMYAECHGQG
jgi:hypothetical protein